MNEAELTKVNSFVSTLRDESHPTLAQSKMLISAPSSWQKDQNILLRRLDVFDQGLRLSDAGRKFHGTWLAALGCAMLFTMVGHSLML